MYELLTAAEKKAVEAEALPAFSGVKLSHIKRNVGELLQQIGGNGIFDEYTRHDISHINSMLEILDWLIPKATAEKMTPADWLMIVLAIYFHDLGMLVTKDEFKNRDKAGFRAFCSEELFSGDQGIDYKAKVEKLEPGDQERFLYQEFVRRHHAERVRHWIMGESRMSLGISESVSNEVDTLLNNLDTVFRRDLGLACESHHLDDLNNFQKYKTRQPYGQRTQEVANVHYCAILLRSADLLHITRDRTPSLTFRTLNPADPVSQREWAKQMAVRAVYPMLGRDKEGNISEDAPTDTVEVHAFFKSPEGFFGLTSYLKYAEQQLKKSNDWAESAIQTQGAKFSFPWKFISTEHIETAGFLSQTFEFTLDQARILDLLTGHTLYNDTSVVLRELVQNALDAVRLQCLIEKKDPRIEGRIRIEWNTHDRTLIVTDNGTGMSQAIIERHLLKVGSSRYQDPDFLKQYPAFSSISRFGIGVLSTFMIADSVEITTNHADDEKARQLTLRSVHGRYLINLLNKETEVPSTIKSHGTCVRLQIRPSAKFEDAVAVARKWIVIPHCRVEVSVDGGEPVVIGYTSPKEALEKQLFDEAKPIKNGEPANGDIRILQFEDPDMGVTLAVAVHWSDYFQEWDFLTGTYELRGIRLPHRSDAVGICIEGIRVETQSPGFDGVKLYAISNASGPSAPRTNVARSGLEDTPQGMQLIETTYRLYLRHIRDEMAALETTRGFSASWAAREVRYLLEPFFEKPQEYSQHEDQVELSHPSAMREALLDLPFMLLEENGNRVKRSLRELQNGESFWTTNSFFFRSAENLLKEASGSGSLTALIAAMDTPALALPAGSVLCGVNHDDDVHKLAFVGKEPAVIKCSPAQRRLDICWSKVTDPPRWIRIPPALINEYWRAGRNYNTMESLLTSWVCSEAGSIKVEGFRGEVAINTVRDWLLPGTKICEFMKQIIGLMSNNILPKQKFLLLEAVHALETCLKRSVSNEERLINQLYDENPSLGDLIPRSQLIEIIEDTAYKVFDPWVWDRKDKFSF